MLIESPQEGWIPRRPKDMEAHGYGSPTSQARGCAGVTQDLQMWRQNKKGFKVIFGYTESSRSSWAT